MIPYAQRKCFREVHLRLLLRTETYLTRISNAWGNELRCHELARAVHLVVHEAEHKLVVVDGHCGPVEHSWLCCSDGVILDVYAPGRLPQAQLVDPLVGGYRIGGPRSDIRQSIIDRLVREMRGGAVRRQ